MIDQGAEGRRVGPDTSAASPAPPEPAADWPVVTATVSEARREPRRRTLKKGIIAFNGRHSTLPCVVRDMSLSGARLRVEGTVSLPDNFELIIELDGFEVAVQVMWRRQQEIGLKFVAPPRKVAPKRAQVLKAFVPEHDRPLRRKPRV